MKLIVAIPAYGGQITLQTFRSLMHDLPTLVIGGWEVEILDSIQGAEIDTVRNKIVSRFAASDADELIMVDSDVCWDRDALLRLLAAELDKDRDIIGGVYPRRCDPIDYPFDPITDDAGNVLICPDTKLVECRHLPSGFMRIPKGTAQRLCKEYANLEYLQLWGVHEKDDYPVFSLFEKLWTYDECSGQQVRCSEDVAFCRRVRDAGGSVYAHPDFAMGHVGTKCFLGARINGNSSIDNHKVSS